MRFGYWMPVFGGWLRNVEDEGMSPTWEYNKRLAIRSEQIGFDLSLVAELNLGQLAFVINGRFGMKCEQLNKVQGQPFKISEVLRRIQELAK